MALLWTNKSPSGWEAVPLEEGAHALCADGPRKVDAGFAEASDDADAVLLLSPGSASRKPRGVLVPLPLASEVFVNGCPVALGIRVLSDADEIRCGGVATFFSTESRAVVAPYRGDPDRKVECNRCKKPVEAGSPAVVCPACSVAHHAECWSYSDRCSCCPHPTALDAAPAWCPEEV